MKLFDIISEDPRIDRNTPEVLKQKLIDCPKTTGLSFDNVEIERNGNLIYVKNYSCKLHPEWVRTQWADIYEIRKGKLGCPICTQERNKKIYTADQLTKELIDSPKTSNLTFNDVIYIVIDERKRDIKIKNYSCKLHPTWFKDTPANFYSVKNGNTNCAICRGENKINRIKEFQTKSNIKLKEDLEKNPNTTGLTFNNVEFKREQVPSKTREKIFTRLSIKNYSCKKHKWWKRSDWVRYDGVIGGIVGCRICAILSEDKKRGRIEDHWDGNFDDDENSPYNKWIKKRNNLLQSNWLKISKKEHINPETGKPRYGYDKVNFNDPNTIKIVYNPATK